MVLPSKTRLSSVCETSPGQTPWTLSYLRRWASVAASVRSLTATTSRSAPRLAMARRNSLPIRPKPLMAILVLIDEHSFHGLGRMLSAPLIGASGILA